MPSRKRPARRRNAAYVARGGSSSRPVRGSGRIAGPSDRRRNVEPTPRVATSWQNAAADEFDRLGERPRLDCESSPPLLPKPLPKPEIATATSRIGSSGGKFSAGSFSLSIGSKRSEPLDWSSTKRPASKSLVPGELSPGDWASNAVLWLSEQGVKMPAWHKPGARINNAAHEGSMRPVRRASRPIRSSRAHILKACLAAGPPKILQGLPALESIIRQGQGQNDDFNGFSGKFQIGRASSCLVEFATLTKCIFFPFSLLQTPWRRL